jgi:FAD/FMN-containing dehydrogenase/Fe-S oxidoreductase
MLGYHALFVISGSCMSLDSPLKAQQHPLASKLARHVEGEVLFDAFSRGRYSTDASIYQIMPVGVVVPRNAEAARAALQIAVEEGVAVLPRGAGTSQCGQAVGAALVIDCSKHLTAIGALDPERAEVSVEPGVVLDALNAHLRPHGLCFPVDVSTSAQATLGGMAGNNSCGARSLRYGNMVHNVQAIDAWLPGGENFRFGPGEDTPARPAAYRALAQRVHEIVERETAEIDARWPKVLRRVQGYNLDMVQPRQPHNLAHLLVGSEGTLALTRALTLRLAPIPAHRALGVVHFSSFYRAMECTQHIVRLGPSAVELVDRTMIALARGNEAFSATVERFLRGEPDAILLVEFAGEERDVQLAQLDRLAELMAELGLEDSVVQVADPRLQRDIWEVRKAGLNIMMSMKGDGKPVSFIEDCAVPLEHLAEYTDRLTKVFEKHGTKGTWYAHASVGTLHVRPVLDMRRDGAQKMRAIAEEACALVREFKGAFSGEHGDGLVRSEWIEPILGRSLTAALGEVKALFDPRGLMNPGKIVRPPRMDDRSLFRYGPGYGIEANHAVLDWSQWGGLGRAVEMCNNNGHCRKFDAGTMCPSYRVTRDEQHVTRGRANTLRLALSGQLGRDALSSDEMARTMALCVSCKGCKRECPTGVDMARMKIEFLHHYGERRGIRMRQRLIAWLPRYAPALSRYARAVNVAGALPGMQWLLERLLGLSRQRSLPRWATAPFAFSPAAPRSPQPGPEVVLFADTFNRYFEPDNLHDAIAVLRAAGCDVQGAQALDSARPLCCGRTFLAAGLVAQAREEARRVIGALLPHALRGRPIIGLEPSCLLGLRDEYQVLGVRQGDVEVVARHALLFEEFLASEVRAKRLSLPLAPLRQTVLLHGHCHQKAFDAMDAVKQTLGLIPGLEVREIESSCCGMAGNFGFEAEHFAISMKMAEAALLPALRAAPQALVAADGTSCRHQIRDGAGRQALHVARLLRRALKTGGQ